jgi:hypothetical protein
MGWSPCQAAWCGKCYKPGAHDNYPVKELMEEDGTPVVRSLRDKNRFIIGRNGDHLVCPFQCDLCHFRNIKRRNPKAGNYQDQTLLTGIRRCNLDALWGREAGTVSSNLSVMLDCVNLSDLRFGVNELSQSSLFPPQGPHPVEDTFGMMIAVVMVEQSMRLGKRSANIQWNTVRKTRSAVSNYHHTTAQSCQLAALRRDQGTRQGFSLSPTYSDWFDRFTIGCHKRMGDDVRPDMAVSIHIMLAIDKAYEERWENCRTPKDRLATAVGCSFFMNGFCAGLRGEELPMLSLDAVVKYLHEPQQVGLEHVTLALKGRIKGEQVEEQCHLIPVVAVTRSGLRPRTWMIRVVETYFTFHITSGWVYRDAKGAAARQGAFELELFEILREIQVHSPDLLSAEVDIPDVYGISRSFRRGYTTHSTNCNIADSDIKRLARWRGVENSGGKQANHGSTKESYCQISLMLPSLLRATREL